MDRFFLCCKEINSAILIQYPTSRCAILGMKTIHKASIIHRLQCFANMSDYRGIAKLEAIQIYVLVALFSITLNFHHYSTFNPTHLERSQCADCFQPSIRVGSNYTGQLFQYSATDMDRMELFESRSGLVISD